MMLIPDHLKYSVCLDYCMRDLVTRPNAGTIVEAISTASSPTDKDISHQYDYDELLQEIAEIDNVLAAAPSTGTTNSDRCESPPRPIFVRPHPHSLYAFCAAPWRDDKSMCPPWGMPLA